MLLMIKPIEVYTELVSGIDGKKYLEGVSFGFQFLSRHKEKCRKPISEDKEHGIRFYRIFSYDRKEGKENYCHCASCDYKILNRGHHDPDNENP